MPRRRGSTSVAGSRGHARRRARPRSCHGSPTITITSPDRVSLDLEVVLLVASRSARARPRPPASRSGAARPGRAGRPRRARCRRTWSSPRSRLRCSRRGGSRRRGPRRSGLEVAEAQREHFVTRRVDGVRQQALVRAHQAHADVDVRRVALELSGVEQERVARPRTALTRRAEVNSSPQLLVVTTSGRAVVVRKPCEFVADRGVSFGDTSRHLIREASDEGTQMVRRGLVEGPLGREVGPDIGVVDCPQPGIPVDTDMSMRFPGLFNPLRVGDTDSRVRRLVHEWQLTPYRWATGRRR